MKTRQFLLFALTAVTLSSCKTVYYQVYKAVPTEQLTIEQNTLAYEDENCKVAYNLWADGGDIGFSFYNKTDHNIYLNMAESFFILNGVAHDYYKDRKLVSGSTIGSNVSTGVSASVDVTGFNFLNLLQTNSGQASKKQGILRTTEQSVTYNEKEVVCIPPGTKKNISEYKVTDMLFRDCDLLRYPERKQVHTKKFYVTESPLLFSNRLAYTVGESKELIRFENGFYVSEITNYPEKEITKYGYYEFCGQKSPKQELYFKNPAPDNFYIRYEKTDLHWKH